MHLACRRDQLRFLKHCDAARFVDGLKEQLTDLQIGMAFYLVCGLPPWHKLREMRCRNLAAMTLSCNGSYINIYIYMYIMFVHSCLLLQPIAPTSPAAQEAETQGST